MGAKSTVAKASSKSPSIRTTIPEGIAKEMGLEVGDVLDWETASEGGKRVMKARKLQ